ncbi:hypothetical protein [Actinomycetospora chiangmaiensis]|uniref:hypothetical protein n=1 Tax=Actinomycetospora chiangmaiensis TaxID=402650 RepID=UPI0003A53220|nr:hypothetical protein [Actinomycetospora chiangmaiensis]
MADAPERSSAPASGRSERAERSGSYGETAARVPVSRLIMISTAHRRWPSNERSCNSQRQLLRRLLDDQLPGRAWFGCIPEEARHAKMERARPNQVLLASMPGAPDQPPMTEDTDPSSWPTDAFDAVDGVIADLRERAIEAIVHPTGFSQDTLRPLRHRVLLDRERFVAVTTWTATDVPRSDFLITLDFRLGEVGPQSISHVSFTLWSAKPWSEHHRPPELQITEADVVSDLDWRSLRTEFVSARDRAAALVDEYFTTANLRVFGRPYRAPTFWTVVPALEECTPAELLARDGELKEPELAELLLGGATSPARLAAMSVIDRDTLALRRFVPNVPRHEDSPTYLLLPTSTRRLRLHRVPAPRTPSPSSPRNSDLERWAEHEDDARRIITVLTDLEAFAAASLWNIETDLDVWDTHLAGYENAADRAARIWDGLANHLVASRGRDLAAVHRSIEMVHQTLLQGVADVDRIATLAAERAAELGRLRETIDQRYAEALFESPCPGRIPVGDSFTGTGHFGVVLRRADDMVGRASRVAPNYRDLLGAIGHAFDERRVREVDSIQRIGVALAVALAGIGGVTVLDALFDAKIPEHSTPWWFWTPIAAAALALGLVGVRTIVRFANVGRLGSRAFRDVYRELWQYLRLTTTDRLNRVRTLIEAGAEQHPTDGLLALILDATDETTRQSIRENVPAALRDVIGGVWLDLDRCKEPSDELRQHLRDALTKPTADRRVRAFLHSTSLTHQLDERDRQRTSVWAAYEAVLTRAFCALWDRIDPLPGDERIIQEHRGIDAGFRHTKASKGLVDLTTAYPGNFPDLVSTGSASSRTRWWSAARREEKGLRRRDREQLANMAEKWSLRTLLVTERPREMYWYSLPQLTLIYRAAFALLDDDRHRDRHAVSYTDMRFVLGQFPRHGLRSEEIEVLDRWLRIQVAELGPPPPGPPRARRGEASGRSVHAYPGGRPPRRPRGLSQWVRTAGRGTAADGRRRDRPHHR